jgi:glycosyltransferase involved in cell wall biosynthesis
LPAIRPDLRPAPREVMRLSSGGLRLGAPTSSRARAAPLSAVGLVMICDVDLSVPDATRTHTIEVAAKFASEGLAVDLITRGPDPGLPGVTFHGAHSPERHKVRRTVALSARSIAVLRERRKTATRCYVRHRWSILAVLIAARLLGYRVVTQVDDVQYGRGYERDIFFLNDYGKRLTTLLMGRLAHGIVAVTSQIRDLLVDQFHVPAERIAVLPNGVDTDRIKPLERHAAIRHAGLDPSRQYLVFCGNFGPWVDFELLLESFARVVGERPDTRLLLIGDGARREPVERLIDGLSLRGAVITTGFVDDRALVANLIGAAIVALAAHRPAYMARIGASPTKLAEYFAAGRAVVARDVPGLREAIEESGAGILVPGDPQEMARAISALLDDPARADELGANGRTAAEQRYTWASIVRRTLPLFDQSSK